MIYGDCITMFADDVVGGCVAECLELLDYMDLIDDLYPPVLVRMFGTVGDYDGLGGPDNPIDLTEDIPVATRLFVDEIDYGGHFGSQGQARRV